MYDRTTELGPRPPVGRGRLGRTALPQMKNRIGEKYGLLTVKFFAGKTAAGMCVWMCECQCGRKAPVRYGNLQSGHTTSCGCKKLVGHHNMTRHGHSAGGRRTPEYCSYEACKARCERLTHHKYPSYGGQGVKFRFVSFEEFFNTLGPRPTGKTCDRHPDPAGD